MVTCRSGWVGKKKKGPRRGVWRRGVWRRGKARGCVADDDSDSISN